MVVLIIYYCKTNFKITILSYHNFVGRVRLQQLWRWEVSPERGTREALSHWPNVKCLRKQQCKLALLSAGGKRESLLERVGVKEELPVGLLLIPTTFRRKSKATCLPTHWFP